MVTADYSGISTGGRSGTPKGVALKVTDQLSDIEHVLSKSKLERFENLDQ